MLNSSILAYWSIWRLRKWQNAWWYSSNLKASNRSSSAWIMSKAFIDGGGSGGPTSKTSSLISSTTDRKMSSLTSRSFFTQALLSSNNSGCVFVELVTGEKKLGPVPGIGIGLVPSQCPQVPLDLNAAFTPRLHRAYCGPVASRGRMKTPGRRHDMCMADI